MGLLSIIFVSLKHHNVSFDIHLCFSYVINSMLPAYNSRIIDPAWLEYGWLQRVHYRQQKPRLSVQKFPANNTVSFQRSRSDRWLMEVVKVVMIKTDS